MSHTFDGCRVSREWLVVLTAAREDGVRFRLNSGQRTMAEQQKLYDQNMSGGRPRPGHPLTARPDRNAPHIRAGHPHHAIDINALDGGETRLQRWLTVEQNVRPTNPVPGEAWHLELSEPQLVALAAQLEAPTIRKGTINRRGVRQLQRLLRALNVTGVPLNGRYDLRTRAGVKRWQRKHGIPTDARATVGPRTWAALRKAVR